MEQVQRKGAAVEELGGNFLTMLSSSIVNKFEKEFEGKGILFTPELSGQLRKLIVQSYNEIQTSSPSSLTEDVDSRPRTVLEQSAETTIPPLVFQFLKPGNECVMGMMINGKPEVVKNEKGSESTPPCAGVTDDSTLVYGTDAEIYCESKGCFYEFWISFQSDRSSRTVHLKEFGIFDLPTIFFDALLIRKLKITAEESQCNGSLCQAAILAVPMETTYADRLFLKEVALFAGFKDAYVISAEGLAAYYWFHKNETEMQEKNYSKDFVIVKLSQTVVVYKRSFHAGLDGKKNLVATSIVSLSSSTFGGCSETKEDDEFVEVIRKLDGNAVIPVIGNCKRLFWFSNGLRTLDQNKIKSVDKNDDDSDPSKYFAAKGAALLSENPENIGRQVRNMMETMKIKPFNSELPGSMTRRDQILPETVAQQIFNFTHDRAKYRIVQNYETVGYLVINGVEPGSDLQVSYEVSWEGILKIVGVCARNPSDTDERYKAISWKWLIGNKADEPQLGSSSYEACKSLLLKILPSPSEAKVGSTQDDSSKGLPLQTLDEAVEASAPVCSSGDGNGKGETLARKSRDTLPNDMNSCKDNLSKKALVSTTQVKGTSSRLTKVGVIRAGLENSQGQFIGLGSSTIDSEDGNGTQEKKCCRQGRVLCTNDIIVNPHLKKIKLESDWVEPVVKIEQDSMDDDFGEDGNGQRVNFVEREEEIEIEENVVKIEAEEEENITN